jgi:hypothetical protein
LQGNHEWAEEVLETNSSDSCVEEATEATEANFDEQWSEDVNEMKTSQESLQELHGTRWMEETSVHNIKYILDADGNAIDLEDLWYCSTNPAFDKVIDINGIDCRRGTYRGTVWPFCRRDGAEAMARRYGMSRVHRINVVSMRRFYCHERVVIKVVPNGVILDVSRLPGLDWCFVRPQFIETYALCSPVPENRCIWMHLPKGCHVTESSVPEVQFQDCSSKALEICKNECDKPGPEIEFTVKSDYTPLSKKAQPYVSGAGKEGSKNLNLLWYASTSEMFDEQIPISGINCKGGRHAGCVYLTNSFQEVKVTAEHFGLSRVYAVDIGAMKQCYGGLVSMITNLNTTTIRPLTLTVHRLPQPDRFFVRPQFLHCCWLGIPKLLPVHMAPVPEVMNPRHQQALVTMQSDMKMAIMLFSSPVDVRMNGKSIVFPGADDVPSGRWWMKVDPRRTVYTIKRHFVARLQLFIQAEDIEWYACGAALPDDAEIGRVVGHCDTIFVRPRIPDRLVPREPVIQAVDEDFLMVSQVFEVEPKVDQGLEFNSDAILAAQQPNEDEVPACHLWSAAPSPEMQAVSPENTPVKKASDSAHPMSVETTPSLHAGSASPELDFSDGGNSPDILNLAAVDEGGHHLYDEEVCAETGFNVLLKSDREPRHDVKPEQQRLGLIGWLTRCRE